MAEDQACPRCGAQNPGAARFCMGCGGPLALACPACGTEAPPGARFCMACGAALSDLAAGAPAAAAAAPAARPSADGSLGEERRTVTVLFADLSGYTAVAERLDHETVKALVERCLNRFAEEVERYGGHVDKYIGDNVMAVFGAPVAHEDDAERAVRAAFGMQAAMTELNSGFAAELDLELALRVGINTGEVLAGRVGDAYTVLGDAVNVASRLQSAAPVGGILVGERTQRLTGAAIAYRELEPLRVKGKSQPVACWEAMEPLATGTPSRPATRRTALVGRDSELAQLEALFDRVARDAASHLVTVIGQAGVGKSRLLAELEERLQLRDAPVRMLRGRCLAFGSRAVYWPLSEMLRDECEILEGDAPAQVRAKLAGRLEPLLATQDAPEVLERRLAPIARLLGAEAAGEEEGAGSEDQQSAREGFFGTVRSVLEALARERPLVLAWEDIHWADEGTLDLIEYLSQWLRAPVLQVCLARDELLERRPAWSTLRRTVTTTFLEPLGTADARRLVLALMGAAGETSGLPEALAERSGGNPLFAEAMVRRIAEEDGATAAELPDTVQGLLAARLDALEPFERQLVSHAAVIGRTFWESALEPLAQAAGAELEPTLARLREKDILIPGERHLVDEPELSFKHVLIRDVAYEMLPKAVRARKHAEVGAFIAERARGREGIVALVAEHYACAAALGAEAHLPGAELAQLRAHALRLGEEAGDAAAALYSNLEALAHYDAALELAGEEVQSELRIAEKLGDVALRLGRVEQAIEAWQRCLERVADDAELERVAELHRKIGAALAHKGARKEAIEHHQKGINLIKDRPPSLALVRLYEEAAWLYMQVGDNMLAIYASEKALRLAESLGEARAASRAHGIFGRVFGRIGDAARARENLEQAVALARDSDASETVLALLALGHNLEHSEGDYTGAQQRYAEALELAERIGEVPAQIELRSALAQLAFYRCDWEQVRSETEASAELAEREGLVGKLCLANVLRGRMRWRDGEWEESARLFGLAHELAEQVGWSEVSFSALTGLASTLRDKGDLAGAEEALARGLAICERAGLVPQSAQANAALAITRALAEELPRAREAAEQAEQLGERVHEPVAEAAALEAAGFVDDSPGGLDALARARAAWERLGRPLEVARCELLRGRRLLAADPAAARDTLEHAGTLYERLEVPHLAARARELSASAVQPAPAGDG